MSQILTKIDQYGNERWKLDGFLHRHDGPAIIYTNGIKSWYYHGKRHCLTGPAIDWGHCLSDPKVDYFVDDKPVTKEFIDWIQENNIRWPFNKETKAWIKLVWDEYA